MKTLKNILAVAIVAIAIISCKNETQPEVKTIDIKATIAKTEKVLNPDATYIKSEFTIEGMTCEIGCARTIQKKIAKMDGVKSAKVDFERKLAMVEYDEAVVNHESLENTVSKTADIYKVTDIKTVMSFSAKKDCAEDCTKDCCKNKTEAEKKTCAEDCKKACCKEEKAES